MAFCANCLETTHREVQKAQYKKKYVCNFFASHTLEQISRVTNDNFFPTGKTSTS